jgi:hypothetical protein
MQGCRDFLNAVDYNDSIEKEEKGGQVCACIEPRYRNNRKLWCRLGTVIEKVC